MLSALFNSRRNWIFEYCSIIEAFLHFHLCTGLPILFVTSPPAWPQEAYRPRPPPGHDCRFFFWIFLPKCFANFFCQNSLPLYIRVYPLPNTPPSDWTCTSGGKIWKYRGQHPPSSPVDSHTKYKNITFPHTSCVGGNNRVLSMKVLSCVNTLLLWRHRCFPVMKRMFKWGYDECKAHRHQCNL